MAAINNSINLTDRMSPVLKSMLKAMDSTIKAMEQMDRTMNQAGNNRAIQRASQDMNEAKRAMDRLLGTSTHFAGLARDMNAVEFAAYGIKKALQGVSSVAGGMFSKLGGGLQIGGNKLIDLGSRIQSSNMGPGFGSLLKYGGGSLLMGAGAGISGLGSIVGRIPAVVSTAFGLAKNSVSDFFGFISKSANMSFTELNSLIQLMTGGFQMLSSLTSFSDRVTSDLAKVKLFNYDPNTTDAQAYGMVYQAAQNSRGNLSDTTQLVNRIMMSGVYGQEEGSFGAATRMAETLNKALTVSGGTSEESKRALLQLSQALSSGVLQGDELRSIREQAPYLAKVLAEGLGKIDDKFIGTTIGDLKELGAAGELTSDVVIRAFEAMQDEVDATFESSAPKTWGQGVDSIKNTIQVILGYLQQMEGGPLEKISELVWQISDYLQSEQGIAILAGIAIILGVIGDVLNWVVSMALQGISWLMDNSWALIAILGALAIMALAAGASMLLSFLMAAWPLLLIIATLLGVCGAMAQMGMTTNEIAGVIAGILFTLAAFIYNSVIRPIWNAFAAVANFIGNLFIDPVAAIKILFLDMAIYVLDTLKSMLGAVETLINKIPGVSIDITSGIAGWLGGFQDLKSQIQDESDWTEFVGQMEEWSYDAAWDSGYQFGSDMVDSIGDMSMNLTDFMSGNEGRYDQMAGGLDNISGGVPINGGNLDSVGSIKSDVNLNDEDIQLLRDMAARDYLLNLQQITPVAHIKFGDVRETADVNKIMDVIEDMVEEQMATALVEN